MLKRLSCCYAPLWVVLKHLLKQVEALVVHLLRLDNLAQVHRLIVRPAYLGKLLVLRDARPALLCWKSLDPKDLLQLSCFVLTFKQWVVYGELCEDAAN